MVLAWLALPALVYYVWICQTYHHGQLVLPSPGMLHQLPRPTLKSMVVIIGWVGYQAILQVLLPGRRALGLPLPDGGRLEYRLNGLLSLLVTIVLLTVLLIGTNTPAWVVGNLGPLLSTTNIVALGVTVFLLLRGRHEPGDSPGPIRRFWYGSELNPRIGRFDLKLFFEARPGLVGWVAIDVCLAARQQQEHVLSASMILVCAFQLAYVLDYFVHEEAVLSTYDIRHEKFGWMLCWGDLVWVPFLYTVQARYLADHDPGLGASALTAITVLNAAGYVVFRRSNLQKHTFRNNPQTPVWGEAPHFITTANGSLLLVSGWWRLARHINYLGDIAMSAAWCLLCGFDSPLPYLYIAYFVVLLVHRERRDNRICQAKYGADWTEYRARVPYRIIPGVY
ncbi:MAG: erg [Frankiales bacterium]|nr:erg [Frankiales bacterium]